MLKNESWQTLMEIVSSLGTVEAYVCFLVFCFNLMPKPACLYLWSGFTFANYTINQLNSWYEEPRPYWVSDKISASHCDSGFGNPSGHMLNFSFFWLSIYLHSFHDVMHERAGGKVNFWRAKLVQFFTATVLLALFGLMAVS